MRSPRGRRPGPADIEVAADEIRALEDDDRELVCQIVEALERETM